MYDDDDQQLDDRFNIQWLSPWNYPTRCTPDFIEYVAQAILHGATFAAASMAQGVSPSRSREWLRWGEEAYNADGDGHHRHAAYLDLFIKVMQAQGLAIVPLQQEVYHTKRDWWLAHHPEARGEWGGDSSQAILALPAPDSDVVEADITPPKAQPEELRTMLRTLIEAGAATIGATVEDEAAGPRIVSAEPDDEEQVG